MISLEKMSILMPVRNGSQFLQNSIQNIESNVRSFDEIIVVNDGSVDETSRMLYEWSLRNQQVRILNSNGTGLVNSLNLGISEASNNWIARFDVDDSYPSFRLIEQSKMLDDKTAAIFCDYRFQNPMGIDLGSIPSAVSAPATAVSLISSQRTPHPGALLNKNALIDAGGYRNEDFPAEDLSLWLRLAKNAQIVSVPMVLLNYRLSKNSVSAEKRKLALEQTKKLLQVIGIDENSIRECLDSWHKHFLEYSDMTLSSERKLLFYRDLKRCLIFLKNKSAIKSEIRDLEIYLLRDYKTLYGFNYLLTGKLKRILYRNF